jgi:hypothetical protein
MDSLHAEAPTDEELLAFALDGDDLPEKARKHLEQCETCQKRLARYQQVNTFLVSHLYRSQCPTGTQLSYYCAHMLPEDESMRIAAHITECPLCAAEVAETRHFLQMQDSDLLPLPSFSPATSIRRIFATLVRQQPQFVTRGEASDTQPNAAWPRHYKADSLDLSLHLSRASSGAYMLQGILTSTDAAENVDAFEGIPAYLHTAPGLFANEGDKDAKVPLRSTQVDDLGNIVFSNVPTGNYVMVVHLPGRELVIDGLTIGE